MEQVLAIGARRRNDPTAVRGKVLDAAFCLFQSKGYNGTSMSDIAATAGVTSGAMHHHFPTKKILGLSAIRERVASAVEETWLMPLEQAPSAMQGVAGIFRRLARELDQQGAVRGCPVNNLALELAFADADFRAEIRQLFDRWRGALVAKLRSDASIPYRGDELESFATLLVASYSGAMAIAKAEQRGRALAQCADRLEAMLVPSRGVKE